MSRALQDLHPDVERKVRRWVERCRERGVEVLIYCTYRSAEEQAALFAQGRTIPGPIRTKAEPWRSWHNYRRAVDAVPMVHGKPDWSYTDLNLDRVPDEAWWRVMAEEADLVGLEWAGRWHGFREYVHFQDTGGLTLDQARALLRDRGV